MKMVGKILGIIVSILVISGLIFLSIGTNHEEYQGTDYEKLKAFLGDNAKDIDFSGSILVAKNNEVIGRSLFKE